MRAGVALASKLTRASPAMLRYEPYEALSARGGWERQLGELEQPVGLAVGGAFVAAATDTHTVHIFTSAGVHSDEVAVGGAVVAVAAQGPLLAVAWHRAAPTAAGEQCMDLLVRPSRSRELAEDAAAVLWFRSRGFIPPSEHAPDGWS